LRFNKTPLGGEMDVTLSAVRNLQNRKLRSCGHTEQMKEERLSPPPPKKINVCIGHHSEEEGDLYISGKRIMKDRGLEEWRTGEQITMEFFDN